MHGNNTIVICTDKKLPLGKKSMKIPLKFSKYTEKYVNFWDINYPFLITPTLYIDPNIEHSLTLITKVFEQPLCAEILPISSTHANCHMHWVIIHGMQLNASWQRTTPAAFLVYSWSVTIQRESTEAECQWWQDAVISNGVNKWHGWFVLLASNWKALSPTLLHFIITTNPPWAEQPLVI